MSEALPMAECRLDPDGLRTQLERYRRLAGSVRRLDRRPGELLVEFGEEVDRTLLEETLAVERQCCAFFRLEYAPDERRLSVGVEHPHQSAAIDALHFALDPADAHPHEVRDGARAVRLPA